MGTSASMVPEGCSRHAPRLQGGQVPALASRARRPCLESKSAAQDLPLVGDPVAPSRQPILQEATSRRIGRRSPMEKLRTRKRRRHCSGAVRPLLLAIIPDAESTKNGVLPVQPGRRWRSGYGRRRCLAVRRLIETAWMRTGEPALGDGGRTRCRRCALCP